MKKINSVYGLLFFMFFSNISYSKEIESLSLINQNIEKNEAYLEKKHNSIFKNKNFKILDKNEFSNVINNHLTGIWVTKNDNNIVIILNDGLYEKKPTKEMNKLRKDLRNKKHEITFTETLIDPKAYTFSENNIKIINLSNNFFTFKFPQLVNDDIRPLLNKFQNEFIAYHEYAHIKERQEAMLKYWHQKDKYFDHVLIREIDSDLYALIMVAKNNNLSYEDFLQILNELSSLREYNMYNDFNLGHATHFALNTFKNILSKNKFEDLKNINEKSLQKFTSLFALESIYQLSLGNKNIEIVNNWDLANDLKIFHNKKNEEFIIENKFKSNGNNKKSLTIINYSLFLENAIKEYTDYRGYYKTIEDISSQYLISINQFILLDSYKKIIKLDEFNLIFNNMEHLKK